MFKLTNQKGFTLIELLVTIALIGIISIPLLGLLAASMQNNVHSKSKTSNGAVVQSFMELFRKSGDIFSLFDTNDTTSIYLSYKDDDVISMDLSDYPDSSGSTKYYKSTSNGNETYTDILNNFTDKQYGDYIVKIVLLKEKDSSTGTYTGVLQINVSVWDKVNKDNSKVSLVSLRSY